MLLRIELSPATVRVDNTAVFQKSWYMTEINAPAPMYQNKAEETESYENEISLEFNGRFLLMRVVTKDAILRFSYRAVSGLPDGRGRRRQFDNSKERQAMVDEGPIPEGNYFIKPQEIQFTGDRDIIDTINGVLGTRVGFGGTFPRGRLSWGIGRVWIYPREVKVTRPSDGKVIKRGNFAIHGSRLRPGSRGCIDLTNNDREFFDKLIEHRGDLTAIPLTVRY